MTMENRTIRVTGRGVLKVHPDTTRLTLSIHGTYPAYQEAMEKSAEDTEALKSALAPLDFDGADLKTLSFGIDAEYEGYQDDHGVYRNRFAGYRFDHSMKLEFRSDSERLGRILAALSASPAKPEIHISYTVSDPEAVKNELLGKAVADAKAKAEVLTASAGVTLGEMCSIDYSWGEHSFEARPMRNALMLDVCAEGAAPRAKALAPDLEPDDIDVSDTVTVIWQIK